MGAKGQPKTPGSGRKRGTPNKTHRPAFANRYRRGGQLPLDYMLEVMRSSKASDLRRDDMAKAAAPYLHARRVPETGEGKTESPITLTVNVDPLAKPIE